MPVGDVVEALHRAAPDLPVVAVAETRAAVAAALAEATPRDLVCVAGSLYLAGEALRAFAAHSEEAASAIEIAGVDH